MIVQHNIMAINSHRQLGINNTNLGKNLEKLSSGYRINRAADDAAGLAISEKMRAQITALNRAVLNAQDGSSLIQTAEGALQEVHGMLNRMVELATQSANGTIQADDRQKIESELEALKGEIDRISKATNFNGIKLLDGSLSGGGSSSSATSPAVALAGLEGMTDYVGATASVYANQITAGTAGHAAGDTLSFGIVLDNGEAFTFNFTYTAAGITKLVAEDGTEYDISAATGPNTDIANALLGEINKNETLAGLFDVTTASGKLTFTSKETGAEVPSIAATFLNGSNATAANKPTSAAVAADAVTGADAYETLDVIGEDTVGTVFSVNGKKFQIIEAADTEALLNAQKEGINALVFTDAGTGKPVAADVDNFAAQINAVTGLGVESDGAGVLSFKNAPAGSAAAGVGGLTMQVGETNDDWNKITVSVDDMSSAGLGIAGISMADQEAAAAALKNINAAIEKVSVNRGNLGALQNRLEHTINNLNVTSENMTAAESRIRDVDMAKEMMQFTKNNVLSQAAQAMLAQANQQPQQVLQLLR